jgi:hypothetical protein
MSISTSDDSTVAAASRTDQTGWAKKSRMRSSRSGRSANSSCALELPPHLVPAKSILEQLADPVFSRDRAAERRFPPSFDRNQVSAAFLHAARCKRRAVASRVCHIRRGSFDFSDLDLEELPNRCPKPLVSNHLQWVVSLEGQVECEIAKDRLSGTEVAVGQPLKMPALHQFGLPSVD